jgi:glycosyltransferase involved in cell wall biosynthesis
VAILFLPSNGKTVYFNSTEDYNLYREKMKRSVLLNWLPFENTATGAAKRAIELHKRLSDEFDLTAAVTQGFSQDVAPCVTKTIVAQRRSLSVRISERLPGFWEKAGVSDIWVTDTLPVPQFRGSVKTVLTVHDLRFLAGRKYLSLPRYLLLKLSMKTGLNRADAVVTVSSWIAGQIVEKYSIPRQKLYVVPNAAAPLPPAEGNNGRKHILAVGHLEARKSINTLIRAFSMIMNDWNGDLVLAGSGPLESDLRSLTETLKCSSRVKFKGRVSDSELAALYIQSTCLVCPSVYEGFGMTILEGFAAGVPVVASAIPPHMEVAGDAAVWFKPGNPGDLAAVLKRFLTGEEKVNSIRGAARAKMFNWDDFAQQLASVYRSI